MLVRKVDHPTDADEFWVLLRKPFQAKWFVGLSPGYLKKKIAENQYVMLHFDDGVIQHRKWGTDLRDLKEHFIKVTARMTGIRPKVMAEKLFDINEELQDKKYRRNRPVRLRDHYKKSRGYKERKGLLRKRGTNLY